jgi:hypothetical protein
LEELAYVRRLLSERSGEGEALAERYPNRADAKVREFKERMEAAIEERDRTDEDANA